MTNLESLKSPNQYKICFFTLKHIFCNPKVLGSVILVPGKAVQAKSCRQGQSVAQKGKVLLSRAKSCELVQAKVKS